MGANLDSQTTCQFASIRFGPEQLDVRFRQIVDDLEISYYQHWKHGLSRPFLGFDVQPTVEQSKALFDQLHGLIWHFYTLVFHVLNQEASASRRADPERYRFQRDDADNIIVDKYQDTKARIAAWPDPIAVVAIKARLDLIFGRVFIWP